MSGMKPSTDAARQQPEVRSSNPNAIQGQRPGGGRVGSAVQTENSYSIGVLEQCRVELRELLTISMSERSGINCESMYGWVVENLDRALFGLKC
jgi:hypothetical protein